MIIRKFFTLICLWSFANILFAQTNNATPETIKLSLPEVIALAQSDAPDALLAETRLNNSYWRYQSSLADFKPSIILNGNLPNLNRDIDIIPLPSGRDTFVQRAQMQNYLGIGLQQTVPWTGGTVFVNSNLRRLDIFEKNKENSVSYFSSPVLIGFEQPLFSFNELKWDKKIEPLIYQEATKAFAENMEDVAYLAAELYFDVYTAQLNLIAAQQDKANADTLLRISKGRFEVGRIAETDLLKIELDAMNANANVAQATLQLSSSTEELRNFLGISKAVVFELTPPTDIPEFIIDPSQALKVATQNRSEIISFERRLLEADSDVARAKANTGLNANLSGSFSISKVANKLDEAYASPWADNESFSLGFSIPIADWGKAKSQLEVASSRQKLEQVTVAQARINFEREIFLKVQQFDLVRNQVALSIRAYEVAQKRQELTRNRYFIGKIGILELGLAIAEQESARRSYMDALRAFWLAHYDMRRITLYDFERNVSLVRKGKD